MKFKLDENLGHRWKPLFEAHGYDAETVLQEGMSGAPDSDIFAACQREGRCLISLDMDFADIVRFPSKGTAGVVVLRPPRGSSQSILEALIRSLLSVLERDSVAGSLWVVEPGRVRIHESD